MSKCCWLIFCVTQAAAVTSYAQSIRIDLVDEPLGNALELVQQQAAVNVVFAERLVEDELVTCSYHGNSATTALACILEGTELRAEQVRRRQFVLVRSDPSVAEFPRGSIAGYVRDGETGEVLQGAHVFLPDLRMGTVTNSAGYFSISRLPAGRYDVRISYLGFQSADLRLSANETEVDVYLPTTAIESEGVVIEQRKGLPNELTTVPGLVPVPARQLAALPSFLGEKDLFQALKWVPGVQAQGEVGGDLIVRGGESDQNLYLLDGVPVYHPWHTFSLFSTFQTETLKEVRLYKGAFPAEFGGRLSAVMDAQMKDGSRPDIKVMGGLSLVSARIMAEGPLTDRLSFMAAARRSYLDLIFGRRRPIRSTDGTADTLRIGYYFYDLNAKFTYRLSRNERISFTAYGGADDLDVRIPFQSLLDPDEQIRSGGLALATAHQWGNQIYNLRYQNLLRERVFLTATLYQTRYRALETAFVQPTTSASVDSDYRVRIRDYGAKVDIDYYHSLAHQIRGGVHVVEHDFRSALDAVVQLSAGAIDSLRQEGRLSAIEASAYLQDTWQPARSWRLQPGLRMTYFSQGSYFRLTPRFFARYAVIPDRLALKGGTSMQVQYMHRIRDRYSFVYDLSSSRWIPAGREVLPGSGVNVSMGAEAIPLDHLNFSVDVYWRRFRNVLFPKDEYRFKDGLEGPGIDVGALLSQYAPGFGTAYGVEILADYGRRKWNIWLGYTLGRAFQRAASLERPEAHPTRFDIPHDFHSALEWSNGRWTATFAGAIRSGFPFTIPTARYAVGDPLDGDGLYLYRPSIHNGRLPAYMRLDIAVGYHFSGFGLDWQAQFQVFNVTNRRNVVGRQYDPEMNIVRPIDRYGLPILPVLEIAIEW